MSVGVGALPLHTTTVRSTPCNTKEAKANREAESNEKMAVVKLLHFGAS